MSKKQPIFPNNKEKKLSGKENISKCTNTKATLVFLLMFVLTSPAIKLVDKTRAKLANLLETVENIDVGKISGETKARVLELVEEGLSLLGPNDACAGGLDDLMKTVKQDTAMTAEEVEAQKKANAMTAEEVEAQKKANAELDREIARIQSENEEIRKEIEDLMKINNELRVKIKDNIRATKQAKIEAELEYQRNERILTINEKWKCLNDIYLKGRSSSKLEIKQALYDINYILANLNVYDKEMQEKTKKMMSEMKKHFESLK